MDPEISWSVLEKFLAPSHIKKYRITHQLNEKYSDFKDNNV